MVRCVVNGIETSIPAETTTVGQWLTQLEQSPEGVVITEVRVDGRPSLAQGRWYLNFLPLEKVQVLEVEQTTVRDMSRRNLGHADSYLERFLPGLAALATRFRQGEEREAADSLVEALEGIQWFLGLFAGFEVLAHHDLKAVPFRGRTLADFVDRLKSLVTETAEAQRNQDWVLLADLFDYELRPLFQEVRDELPGLRAWLDTR